MKFEQFWEKLRNELKDNVELSTIDYNAPFQAKFDNTKIIITPISSGEEYYLSQNQLEKAWKLAMNLSDEQRFKYQFYKLNNIQQPSYTIALLRIFTKNKIME